MFVVTVHFTILPEALDEFTLLITENARMSVSQEVACQVFDVCVDPADARKFFLYEVYDNAAAFKAHLESDHFREFDSRVSPMVVDKQVASLNKLPV